MAEFRVLIIGGLCDGQHAVIDNSYEKHAVWPDDLDRYKVVDRVKTGGRIYDGPNKQIYHLSRFILPEGMVYYLCNEPDASQLCDWALGMIRDRLRKFEAQKKARYYD